MTSDNNPAGQSSTGVHVTETYSTGGKYDPLTMEDRDIDLLDRTGDKPFDHKESKSANQRMTESRAVLPNVFHFGHHKD